MKVCHVTSLHKRYDNRIFEKQCKSLVEAGFQVTLIVNDHLPSETIDQIEIVSTVKTHKSRIHNFLFSTGSILRKALEVNADVYQLHDPNLILLGNTLRKRGKIVIFDSHESVPDQIKEKVWIPAALRIPISMVYSLFEKHYLKKFAGVISVSPQIVDRLKKINQNTVMITNYPKIKKAELNRHPTKALCFAGTINAEWNHMEILDVIQSMEDVTYYLAGPFDPKYLEELKKHPGWKKVKYLGMISHKEVQEVYAKSGLGVALNSSKQLGKIGTLGNTKIFEFMEAGLPFICTDYILWKDILDQYKCGLYVDPKNKREIRDALVYLFDHEEEAIRMGVNGRKAIEEQYNWDHQKVIFLHFYKRILEGKK